MSTDAAFEAPDNLETAVRLLHEAGAEGRALAGGTDLIVQMQTGRRRPKLLVDLKRIPELLRLDLTAEGLHLGAALPNAALREHAEVEKVFPGLVEAAGLIGSEQIQGRASVGGNLCNASPAADTIPALIATGARARMVGPQGEREIPVEDFCTGPGQSALGEGEILVELFVPRPPAGTADAYLRLIPRTEMDIAVAGAAVQLTLDGDACTAARVSIGAVAPTPLAVPAAAAALVGTQLSDDALAQAADAARALAQPIDDVRGPAEYRIQVVGVLVKRAAKRAAERARARG